jgi:hypothetical protein
VVLVVVDVVVVGEVRNGFHASMFTGPTSSTVPADVGVRMTLEPGPAKLLPFDDDSSEPLPSDDESDDMPSRRLASRIAGSNVYVSTYSESGWSLSTTFPAMRRSLPCIACVALTLLLHICVVRDFISPSASWGVDLDRTQMRQGRREQQASLGSPRALVRRRWRRLRGPEQDNH